MRVSAALLDFPNAARAEQFTDRLSDVSGGATRVCDLPENSAWTRGCLAFYTLASQTNKHGETAVAAAIRGADGQETSCDYTRRRLTAAC